MHRAMPDVAMVYVECYAAISRLRAADILAWLPAVAAARLAEGIVDEHDALLRFAGIASAE